jgi:nitroimidazol reductase NimA-like FMN-containing flavoprotein (pyridoxamine 5'-phosphate oxidase superfamily)
VCRVATANPEGQPHLVPVCHVLVGGKLYIGSGDEGAKVRNLRSNPRITVTVDLYAEYWAELKGVMVQGTAKLIERGPAFQRAKRTLYEKYPQYAKEAALAPSDSVIVEITPTHVFSWGLD